MTASLRDEPLERPVLASRLLHGGAIWDAHQETVDLGEAGVVTRDVIVHPGAVAILALDEQDRALVIQQYRHPIAALEWEIPAGLLDVRAEALLAAAQRELHEEADLTARTWHVLADYRSSPGYSNEALRIFLARDLSPVPESERHERAAEELGMPCRWVPLPDLVGAVLEGQLANPALMIAALAASAMREQGWAGLRPVNTPWFGRAAS